MIIENIFDNLEKAESANILREGGFVIPHIAHENNSYFIEGSPLPPGWEGHPSLPNLILPDSLLRQALYSYCRKFNLEIGALIAEPHSNLLNLLTLKDSSGKEGSLYVPNNYSHFKSSNITNPHIAITLHAIVSRYIAALTRNRYLASYLGHIGFTSNTDSLELIPIDLYFPALGKFGRRNQFQSRSKQNEFIRVAYEISHSFQSPLLQVIFDNQGILQKISLMDNNAVYYLSATSSYIGMNIHDINSALTLHMIITRFINEYVVSFY